MDEDGPVRAWKRNANARDLTRRTRRRGGQTQAAGHLALQGLLKFACHAQSLAIYPDEVLRADGKWHLGELADWPPLTQPFCVLTDVTERRRHQGSRDPEGKSRPKICS